jgi:hypothetical protein
MGSIDYIKFSNFWPGFDAEDNFILEALADQEVFSPIEVTSVFASPPRPLLGGFLSWVKPEPKSRFSGIMPRRVWFTGENREPLFKTLPTIEPLIAALKGKPGS